MGATFFEAEASGLQQVDGGVRDQDLSGLSQLADAGRGVHGQTAHIPGNELDLAGMHRSADVQLERSDRGANGCRTADGARGTVEHRQEPVSGGGDLASAISVELPPHDRVVLSALMANDVGLLIVLIITLMSVLIGLWVGITISGW